MMRTRPFGPTGREVSEIGFGAWAIGASWGHVAEDDVIAALNAALDAGVTFIDTADVYGDGRSERLIARAPACCMDRFEQFQKVSADHKRNLGPKRRESLRLDRFSGSSCELLSSRSHLRLL